MNAITNFSNSKPVLENQGDKPPVKELSFIVQSTLNVIDGSIKGYITYWITKVFFDDTVQQRPYILLGIWEGTIVSALSLTRIVGLKVLGDSSKYSSSNPQLSEIEQQGTPFDRLRIRSWKLISKCEGIANKIDDIFSRTFKIRTLQQINVRSIPDLELTFAEIVRKAFLEQAESSFVNITSRWGSLKIIHSMGYILPGVNILLGIAILDLVSGCLSKIEKQVKAQYEERKKMIQLERTKGQPESQSVPQLPVQSRFSRIRDWITGKNTTQVSVAV